MPLLQVNGLTRYYGDNCAIRDISFTMERGEIVGFLGPNGAGKTTTMKIITGIIGANSGTVVIDGMDTLLHLKKVKRMIGYLPENPPLYSDMTVTGYLKFAARIKGVPSSESEGAVDRVLKSCGLEEVRERMIGHLSKGFRQRVGIAQALVHSPQLLILDEPTIGLDPKQVVEIRYLIGRLKGERTVILSTHILQEVETICRRVIIINEGRIVADAPFDSLKERFGDLETAFIRLTSGEEVQVTSSAR